MTVRKAELPLHSGSAGLVFRRMVGMAGAIGTLVVRDSCSAVSSDPFGSRLSAASSASIGIRAA